MTRRCEICERDRRVPDEIKPKGVRCAECRKRLRKEYERRYNAANRERKAAYSRRYYAEHREQVRATQRMWYEHHHEQVKARAREWREAHPDQRREYMREYHRRWYAELKDDPERYQDYLERKRFEDRLRAERNGTPLAPATGRGFGWKPAPKGTHGGPMLSAGPLREFLTSRYPGWDMVTLARQLGADDAGLGRLMRGDYKTVSLHVADRILTRADGPHLLALLYPESNGNGHSRNGAGPQPLEGSHRTADTLDAPIASGAITSRREHT